MTLGCYEELGHVAVRFGQQTSSYEATATRLRSVARRVEVIARNFSAVGGLLAGTTRIATIQLISRVDVVTGGASAAYGSDAVSGVVNIVTDRRLQGFKADGSYGISQQGDSAERRLSLAYGTAFAADRGHVVVGGEYVKSTGVDSFFDRDWGRLQGELVSYIGARPAGTPSRFYTTGVQSIAYAYGGVILGNNADTNPANGADVLRDIQFGPAARSSRSPTARSSAPRRSTSPRQSRPLRAQQPATRAAG